jgi:hypothetical protein
MYIGHQKIVVNGSLPGHACSLHFCFCALSPSQGLPPCNGAGLLQERSILNVYRTSENCGNKRVWRYKEGQ